MNGPFDIIPAPKDGEARPGRRHFDLPNVLLTSAGRRNYLFAQFRAALAGRGRVMAADCRADAAALVEADAGFVLPPVEDPHYPDKLLELCRAERIGLVIPLNDLELPVLAQQRDRFRAAGIVILVSAPETVELCFDKLATARRLRKWGFSTPTTFDELGPALQAIDAGRLLLPVVVKPRRGSGSVGVEICRDRRELVLAYQLQALRLERTAPDEATAADPGRAVLVQECLVGHEYGLDIVNDFSGHNVAVFVKRKLAMRAGETDKAETVESPDLVRVGREIGNRLGHVGNLDCDVFRNRQGIHILELNPRLGGGYPFSLAAGADLPSVFIAWHRGNPADPDRLQVQPGICAAKCDRVVTHRAR